MIIAIDASRANEEKKTGVGWYAYHIIEHFKHLSTLASEQSNTRQPVKVVLYSREKLKGELAVLPANWESKVLKWAPKRFWTQIRLSCEMFLHSPDVLFIPAHVFPIIHPKKTVMTLHDIAAVKFPEAYNWFEKWYTIWSAKTALKRLWRIIVPSEFTKKELISNFKFQISNCNVVAHGYDERYHKDITDTEMLEILKKYNIEKPYLLSIGRLEEKKNTVRIIKAFNQINQKSEIKNLKLVLIGNRGFGYEKVEQEINKSTYKNDIIALGWVNDEDLPALMRGADTFVFPSLYEGFGIPILEALASGTPVVASRASTSLSMTASQEIGGDACEYVDPLKVDSIANGILRVIDNEGFPSEADPSMSERLKIIKKGKERVKNFSWKKCAEETWHILNYV